MEEGEEIKAFHRLVGRKNERKKIGCVENFFLGPTIYFPSKLGKNNRENSHQYEFTKILPLYHRASLV